MNLLSDSEEEISSDVSSLKKSESVMQPKATPIKPVDEKTKLAWQAEKQTLMEIDAELTHSYEK